MVASRCGAAVPGRSRRSHLAATERPAHSVVGDTKSAPTGSDRYVQTIDRNIDPDIVKLVHLRTSSLLMRVRAVATVRVSKIWRERQAHPRPNSLDAHGLPAMTGAGCTEAPVTLRMLLSRHTRRAAPAVSNSRDRARKPGCVQRYSSGTPARLSPVRKVVSSRARVAGPAKSLALPIRSAAMLAGAPQ